MLFGNMSAFSIILLILLTITPSIILIEIRRKAKDSIKFSDLGKIQQWQFACNQIWNDKAWCECDRAIDTIQTNGNGEASCKNNCKYFENLQLQF